MDKGLRVNAFKNIYQILIILIVITIITSSLLVAWASDLLDFQIYYGAAKLALGGKSPYSSFGPHSLPYQYFPWFVLLFYPLIAFPIQIAWYIYVCLNIFLLVIILQLLGKKTRAEWDYFIIFFVLALSMLMVQLVFRVGQVSIIHLFIILMVMYFLDCKKPIIAGLLFPFVLLKPHLVLLFIPASWYVGGKKYFVASILSTAFMMALSFYFVPDWITQMANLFIQGQIRNDVLVWDFTTLAGLLGLPRLWNYLLSPFMLAIGIYFSYRFRGFPNFSWLILVLGLSLFAAPYSFAYDLPLLIPIMVYLSGGNNWKTLLFWTLAGFIPLISQYSSYSYVLTIIVIVIALRNFSLLSPDLSYTKGLKEG